MKAFCILLLLACSPICLASQRAVTDEGRVVILSSDGTWAYDDQDDAGDTAIPTNPNAFSKEAGSNFAVRSTRNGSVFWINPKEWVFKKADDGGPAEYSFQLKGSDLYAMAITEAIQIDMGNLVDVALNNAKAAAPDARVVKKEYRTVNGTPVLYMEIAGTISGVKFRYLGHYFSNAGGTTQFLVYTGDNLVTKYESKIAAFLNGFIAGE